MLEFAVIVEILKKEFGEDVFLEIQTNVRQPWVRVDADRLLALCTFLQQDKRLFFDFLHCITGVDYGIKEDKLGVVYHLSSLIHEHQLVLKVSLPRSLEDKTDFFPSVPSVSSIWRAADWHEREAYDMVGIRFENHPDHRRILMPEDWPGHPLRKDYENPDSYHDIKVDY